MLHFTQPDDSNSPLSKSTRHLLGPDPRYYYERGNNILRPPYAADPDRSVALHMENNPIDSDSIYNTHGK